MRKDFEYINEHHLSLAMRCIKAEGIPHIRRIIKYCAVFDDHAYPPRYLVSLAGYFAGKFVRYRKTKPHSAVKLFLKKRGINVVEKDSIKRYIMPKVVKEKIHLKYVDLEEEIFLPEVETEIELLKRNYSEHQIEIPDVHTALINNLRRSLIGQYGPKGISVEHQIANNRRVDLFLEHGDRVELYEVKSYANLKHSIRLAVGQLLEYRALLEDKKIPKVYIVSHIVATNEELNLIESINKQLQNLVFEYLRIDL